MYNLLFDILFAVKNQAKIDIRRKMIWYSFFFKLASLVGILLKKINNYYFTVLFSHFISREPFI